MRRTTSSVRVSKLFIRFLWLWLEELLLDIEIILNNRLLTYIEEEIDCPILTPNSLILGRDVNFPHAAPHENESETTKKRHNYIKGCKEALWERLKYEYLVALREKHNLKDKDKTFQNQRRWRSND